MIMASDEGDGGEDEAFMGMHVAMLQGKGLASNRAYLDNCSTVTAFKDAKYIANLRTTKSGMTVNCNAGAVKTNQVGQFGKIRAWYMPDGIANIFSMHQLEKLYRITYDSWLGYYIVHTQDGPVRFHKDKQGLPYIDLDASGEAAATMLVQTVRGNYEGYTKKEVKRAKEARVLQGMIGGPSDKDYTTLVSAKMVSDCDVATADITNARNIFGKDLAAVRSKTTRKKPDPVVESYVAVPRDFVLNNKAITLAADVFFVDGIPFLMSVSRRIKFVTVEHTPVRTAKALTRHIKQILRVYYRAGFVVRYVMMDGEFEKVKSELLSTVVNTTAAKEHVADAERTI